jgi:hexokinase
VVVAIVLQFLLPRLQLQDKGYYYERGVSGISPWSPFPDHWICADPRQEEDGKKSISTFRNEVAIKDMGLAESAKRVAAEFEFSDDDVRKAVKEFLREMDEGLQKDGTHLSQIPTFVTAVPNGTEKGLYMAVDLGGTNFRVCSIMLHGNTTFSLTQSKTKIPKELMVAKTSKELFAFLAKQIQLFLEEHHNEHYEGYKKKKQSGNSVDEEEVFDLGFTFSFPVKQTGINSGLLMRWTKGFDIADAVGKDVCALLQDEIDALHLPVRVAALVNDTVGTLMARSYTSPGKTGTLLGAIFGTGTNGAYVEKLEKCSKLLNSSEASGTYDTSTGEMIVNTEWGSFDNALNVLPNTPYDIGLDKDSVNPGIQMFEKRVSGMFLGEILRRAIVALMKDPDCALFKDEDSSLNELHSTTNVDPNSPLFKVWGIDSSFLSLAVSDHEGLHATRQALDKDLCVSAPSIEDARAIKQLATAIGRRAARLSAVAVAAIVINSGSLKPATTADKVGVEPPQGPGSGSSEEDVIDIGVDGSLVEFYPGFEDLMREALREVPEIGESGEKRIRIGIAMDGSGVGAALIALVAGRARRPSAVA